MFEFPIDLLIKQTLRSVVFDSTNMGIMSSRAQHFQSKSNSNLTSTISKEATFYNLLRSPETIKWLFERPNEYMYKIFETESCKDTLQSAKDESELKIIKHRILYNFVKELRDFRPPQAMEWIAFHHYMYFIYRNFLSSTPCTNNETLPNVLVKKMYELVISLTFEDKTQFYVRIITLLREYVMTARDNYDNMNMNGDGITYLKCLLSYYSAFCSAANKIATVLSEFDQFINERFNINWYCLHQRMFFQYFFMVASVQSKVSLFNQLMESNTTHRDVILSYKNFIDDMTVLDKHWELQRRRICSNRDESQLLQKNWKMFEEITKIMRTNFWIIRSDNWKVSQENQELEGHFLAIVEDTWHVADRLISPEGNCVCEDCMTAEFNQSLSNNGQQRLGRNERIVMCYICREILLLDLLGGHTANEHSDMNIPRADLTKSYKWHSSPTIKKGMPVKRPSMKLCKVLSETMAKNKDAHLYKVNDNTFKIKCDNDLGKEPISKRILECPMRNSSEPILKLFNENSKKIPAEITNEQQAVFNISCNTPNDISSVNGQMKNDKEPIMKIASEPPIFASNNFSDEMESCRAAFQEFVRNRRDDVGLKRKVEDKKEMLKKPVLEIKKEEKIENSTEPASDKLSPVNGKSNENACVGHVCGHKCKKEEAPLANSNKKSTCQDSCDHQKETKKCDCAYCEVFGSNVTTHSHKSSETRDRLRTRLNQRKEKINENLKNKTSISPKTIINSDVINNSNIKNDLGSSKLPANTNQYTDQHTNLCNCSQNKTSCQNCTPINIKVLSNTSDKASNTAIESARSIEKVKSAVVTSKSLTDLPDLSDIDGLLDFIQGNKPIDKIAMAQKKAAKKARQKMKKEEERLKKEAEEEARKQEEERLKEEKRREEELIKAQALARQQASQFKKNKKNKQQAKLSVTNETKTKTKNEKKSQSNEESMEETIPAMVTIKRVVENNNSPPTVTITLKGSTPDQDKLLYTLVNGHASDYTDAETKVNGNNNNLKKSKPQEQATKTNEVNSDSKKKKKKNSNAGINQSNVGVNTITTKELKVTLAVDKSFHKGKETVDIPKKGKSNGNPKNKNKNTPKSNSETTKSTSKSPTDSVKDLEIDIPSLKLPPGITITKVSGPITNKNSKSTPSTPPTSTTPTQYQNVPVSKSGVIVVDTEKLIQQSISANATKKSKKKKNKNKQSQESHMNGIENSTSKSDLKPTMVTLKNPIFHTLQTKLVEKSNIPIIPYNEQASITKGENGMVTIRRPRCLQLPVEKESTMSDFLSDLKPVIRADLSNYSSLESTDKHLQSNSITLENGISESSYITSCSNGIYNDGTTYIHSDISKMGLSAHDILWGLPGIEITKVNKNAKTNDSDIKKSCQTADVSIIPTGGSSNGGEKFNFDKDDWPFESVFAPKDILEDDLDADERELEAFKRFCQQSIPPKHKEKVAHLNVKDIVLKKKNDVTYS